MYVASSFYVRKEWIYPGMWFWRAARRPVTAGKRGDRWRQYRAVRGGAAEGGFGRYKGETVKMLSFAMCCTDTEIFKCVVSIFKMCVVLLWKLLCCFGYRVLPCIALLWKLLSRFRYHFFLQLKKDILEGKLVVPYKSAALLASYAVQCTSFNNSLLQI